MTQLLVCGSLGYLFRPKSPTNQKNIISTNCKQIHFSRISLPPPFIPELLSNRCINQTANLIWERKKKKEREQITVLILCYSEQGRSLNGHGNNSPVLVYCFGEKQIMLWSGVLQHSLRNTSLHLGNWNVIFSNWSMQKWACDCHMCSAMRPWPRHFPHPPEICPRHHKLEGRRESFSFTVIKCMREGWHGLWHVSHPSPVTTWLLHPLICHHSSRNALQGTTGKLELLTMYHEILTYGFIGHFSLLFF